MSKCHQVWHRLSTSRHLVYSSRDRLRIFPSPWTHKTAHSLEPAHTEKSALLEHSCSSSAREAAWQVPSPRHPSHTAWRAGCSGPTASCGGWWCDHTPGAGRPKAKKDKWYCFMVVIYLHRRQWQAWGFSVTSSYACKLFGGILCKGHLFRYWRN